MDKSLIIAISGGSGAGKTTYVRDVLNQLTVPSLVISLDDYYRDLSHLTKDERDKVNFDHPAALELELFRSHLTQLASGRPAERPVYDFVTHTRKKETVKLMPEPLIIVDGIFSLQEDLCPFYDLKIFVDVDSDVRLFRRIERDIRERGRVYEHVTQQYFEIVKPMHELYVEPTKNAADIIIPWNQPNPRMVQMIAEYVRLKFGP
jgi:uridine kinase